MLSVGKSYAGENFATLIGQRNLQLLSWITRTLLLGACAANTLGICLSTPYELAEWTSEILGSIVWYAFPLAVLFYLTFRPAPNEVQRVILLVFVAVGFLYFIPGMARDHIFSTPEMHIYFGFAPIVQWLFIIPFTTVYLLVGHFTRVRRHV